MNKRLYRSRKDRVIGGVAGGLAEYFGVDPVLIRILFVVALFVGGSGFLGYIICWFIIPEQPAEPVPVPGTTDATGAAVPPAAPAPVADRKRRGSVLGGLILITLGGLFLADNFLPSFRFEDYWPVILVAIGVGILAKNFRHEPKA